MEVINNHKSIRKFSDKTIPEKLLESIIYSGTRASTTGNMQLYSVVVTRDKKYIEQL
jgi:nitroreductase